MNEWARINKVDEGENGLRSVDTYFHNLFCASYVITDTSLLIIFWWEIALQFWSVLLLSETQQTEMLLPLLPGCLLTLLFVFTFLE